MRLAVIVLNYNDAPTTIEFINHIKQYEAINKIIVVDNASTDDSVEQIKKYKNEKIDLIIADDNGGYGKGNNYGIKYAIETYNPQYLLISNPDIIFEENIILDELEFFNNMNNVGIVTGKMLNTDGTTARNIWKIRKTKECIAENFFIFNRFRKGSGYPEDYFTGKSSKVDVVSGAFFMIKSETIKDVDYFDERTFLYWEEDILAYKLKEKNYDNYILNDDYFIHNHSVSINKNIKSLKKKLDIAEESKRLYMKEYLRINKMTELLEKIIYFVGKNIFTLMKGKLK